MTNPFIIAEISGNHGGKLSNAKALIGQACKAGATAIKLQTYIPSDFCKPGTKCKVGPWKGKDLYEVYKEGQTPLDWHKDLFEEARRLAIPLFSTPFSLEAVDVLEDLGCPVYKIASLEINYIPLIIHAAKTGKPLIISTGMASRGEILDALEAAQSVGAKDITLLKCTTSYPANPASANLLTLLNMKETFKVNVGLSDHTLGSGTACAAAALGATVFEKHIKLDGEETIDSQFSMSSVEFKKYVQDIKDACASLGSVYYGPTEEEKPYMFLRRRQMEDGTWRRQ